MDKWELFSSVKGVRLIGALYCCGLYIRSPPASKTKTNYSVSSVTSLTDLLLGSHLMHACPRGHWGMLTKNYIDIKVQVVSLKQQEKIPV